MSVKSVILDCGPLFLRPVLRRIEASPLGYRLAKGAFWSLFGALVSRGLGLLSSIIVARVLGKVGFGELGMLQSTIGMFGTFAGFGLGLTATRFVAEFRKSDPARAGRILALSGVVAAVTSGLAAAGLFTFAPWLAVRTLAAPHLTDVLRIGAVLLLLSGINGAQTGALSGFEAFKTIAKVNLCSGLANFPLMVAGAYLDGVRGAMWALVLATWINWLLSHVAIRGECARAGVPFSHVGFWQERRVLWTFALPSVLASAMTAPVLWIANSILVHQPGGYAELGVYNAVLRVKQVPEMILAMMIAPLLPVLSQLRAGEAHGEYAKTLRYSLHLSAAVVVPLSTLQLVFPHITLMPYGSDFGGHEWTVRWLMLQSVLIGFFAPLSAIVASLDRMWVGAVNNCLWAAGMLILSWLLIPNYGSSGLAAAMFTTHLICVIGYLLYIFRHEPTLRVLMGFRHRPLDRR